MFAAGNQGDKHPGRSRCTILSPAIGKNVLAVGSTSMGEARLTVTSAVGTPINSTNGFADVNMVSTFSSWGPTLDHRVKPEVVAPGDSVSTLAVVNITTLPLKRLLDFGRSKTSVSRA